MEPALRDEQVASADRTSTAPRPAAQRSTDVEPDPDDPDLEESPLVGAPLVERFLGATVIDEIPVDPSVSPSHNGT